ncbi:hypothetical protein NliqN6_5610 [Naganishia liquefaciens]|uniref:Septin-type G domain-containing protein n=1 Tax=Naganishia liquefaciens TaxID=104408 RepID=A0A8H3TYK6_9TREE|nr:hypothetical protein NliqN6_5610 [Naganishia liquefaciens]
MSSFIDRHASASPMASRARGRKQAKKGVQLTLMVVGTSGTGRTTFVNTLCESNVLDHAAPVDPKMAHVEPGIQIKPITVELEEEGVRVALTVVDTPGFGDNIDNERCFSEILNYIELQYDHILAEESRIKRNPRFKDLRVHACLYFIPPTGHALREIDIELMRRLAPRVNVIPVIGKSDTLTTDELRDFKQRIMEDIEYYSIPVYNFPFDEEEDDEETILDNSELRALLPFALVGSEEDIMINGEAIRGRRYPWGIVEVDNDEHCDFMRLRQALLATHLTDLKEITHDYLYENYRTERLSRAVSSANGPSQENVRPEEIANQTARFKEDQLRREEEKLRELEMKHQREMLMRQQELAAKEESLRALETRLASQTYSH